MDSEEEPVDHELPERFRGPMGVELAKDVLGVKVAREDQVVGPGAGGRVGSKIKERERELKQRIQDLEFDLDQLHTSINAAMRTTEVVEDTLSHRFALLSLNLASRSNPPLSVSGGSAGPRLLSKAGSVDVVDPGDLLRALAWVDSERPKAMMGDAARRAVREVQRVEDSGVGERRLTGVPPTPSRKMPGTPRRGNTPARER